MIQDRALVKNAADEGQVKEAEQKARFHKDQEANDMRAVLDVPAGRRVLWRLLQHCRAMESIWEPSAKIHYNAGRQDVGHYLLSEIVSANEDAFLLMQKEARDRKEKGNV